MASLRYTCRWDLTGTPSQVFQDWSYMIRTSLSRKLYERRNSVVLKSLRILLAEVFDQTDEQ